MVFSPSHLSKQSRPAHHGVEFFFPYFKEDILLCPVETLRVYEEKTFNFCSSSGTSGTNCLLHSFIGSHSVFGQQHAKDSMNKLMFYHLKPGAV